MNFWEFLIRYQGIIGALSGVLLSLWITNWVRYIGNIGVLVDDWDVNFIWENDHGEENSSKNYNPKHSALRIEVELTFFNEAEVDHTLRDFNLVIGDKEILLKGIINVPSRSYKKETISKDVNEDLYRFQEMKEKKAIIKAHYLDRNIILKTKEKF